MIARIVRSSNSICEFDEASGVQPSPLARAARPEIVTIASPRSQTRRRNIRQCILDRYRDVIEQSQGADFGGERVPKLVKQAPRGCPHPGGASAPPGRG